MLQCSDSSDRPVFVRIYICLKACKAGLACYCRPPIWLDACFLKGDYGGQLMSVIERDGNNQIFPIAYVVVEAETKDSWEWFLNLLLDDLQGLNQREYTFISDQQKVYHSCLIFFLLMLLFLIQMWLQLCYLHFTWYYLNCSRFEWECETMSMCEAFLWQPRKRSTLGWNRKKVCVVLQWLKLFKDGRGQC